MPRRYRPPKREIKPDVKYNNEMVAKFINKLMRGGKRSLAARILYNSFDIIEEKMKKSPLDVFEQALNNAAPVLEVKPRRVGGATYLTAGSRWPCAGCCSRLVIAPASLWPRSWPMS